MKTLAWLSPALGIKLLFYRISLLQKLTNSRITSSLVLLQNFARKFLEAWVFCSCFSPHGDENENTSCLCEGKKYICLLQLLDTMRNESFPREIKNNHCIFYIHNSFPTSSFTHKSILGAGSSRTPFFAYSCMHSSVVLWLGVGRNQAAFIPDPFMLQTAVLTHLIVQP